MTMENEAFVSYRDYPRQHRTLERILQKLSEQDLPGAPYVEQYLRHMHRRDLTANTLRAAFTSVKGFLRFLKNQGKTDLPSLLQYGSGSLRGIRAGPRTETGLGRKQSAAGQNVSSVSDRRKSGSLRGAEQAD